MFDECAILVGRKAQAYLEARQFRCKEKAVRPSCVFPETIAKQVSDPSVYGWRQRPEV